MNCRSASRSDWKRLANVDVELMEHKAEQTANRVERPEESFEEKAARVAHQLKTPLSIVEGYARIVSLRLGAVLDSMRDETAEPDKAKSDLEEAESHLGRLLASLEQLGGAVEDLTGGYIDGDLVREAEIQITDVKALMQEVLRTTELLPDRAGSTFELVGPNILIECDRVRLKQALSSIVLRCSRHSELSSLHVKIERSGREAMLTFEDGGEALTEEQLTAVFSNSTTAFAKSKFAVSRVVGLTIAQSIVVSHDGVMTISFDEASGNTIRVRLPAISASPTATE